MCRALRKSRDAEEDRGEMRDAKLNSDNRCERLIRFGTSLFSSVYMRLWSFPAPSPLNAPQILRTKPLEFLQILQWERH
jgi:hypothetical protein